MSRISADELSYAAKEKLRHDTEESLFVACGLALEKIVERILLAGAVSPNCRNESGATPLHVAAINGHDNICKLLITFGAEVNALWDGSTPLHLAVSENRGEAISLLVAVGADMNLKDSTGFTSLHLAAIRGNRSLANYLIQAGADPTLKDGDGQTVAERWNFTKQLPISQREEHEFEPSNDFASEPVGVHAVTSDPALLKIFRKFRSYTEEKKAEAVTPTHYAMKYYRSISIDEMESYLNDNIDSLGVPPSAMKKKFDSLLAPARKKDAVSKAGKLFFEDFCLLWLKAQSMGLL